MTFKPMTYLVSFTLFVLLFMGLGGWFGYGKIADHFLTQAFLDATSINVQVLADQQGQVLRWEDKVPLSQGGFVRILASDRPLPISLAYSGEPGATAQPAPGMQRIPLAANERTEDLRIDKAGRYLYARVFAAASVKAEELTWLYKFDLQGRRLVRRTAVNPILLPAPFLPSGDQR